MRADSYRITGGRALRGRVRVSGSKNGADYAIAAALLSDDDVVLHNVPEIGDVRQMVEILVHLGAKIDYARPNTLRINCSELTRSEVPPRLAKSLRASFLVMGPLLARMGHASCPPPGGDAIGIRPLDVHLTGFRSLGATVEQHGDIFDVRLQGPLQGQRVLLDYPSVMGTLNVMLAATLAEGDDDDHQRRVRAGDREPGVDAERDGREDRVAGYADHEDRGRAVAGRRRTSSDSRPARSRNVRARRRDDARRDRDRRRDPGPPRRADLEDAGGRRTRRDDRWWNACHWARDVRCGECAGAAVPGTRDGPAARSCAAFLTQARGASTIHERVFDNRLLYISELRKMGANVVATGQTAIITGPMKLTAAPVQALDVRAGSACVAGGACRRRYDRDQRCPPHRARARGPAW